MFTAKLIDTDAYWIWPFGDVGDESDQTPHCGLDIPT